MSNKTIYNYWCTKGCSNKNIQAQGKRVKCPTCNKVMKELGIATSIVHVGTQESKIR